MLIPFERTSSVISNMSVPICNRFHDKQASSEKITTFRVTPHWHPRAQASLNVGVTTWTAKIYILLAKISDAVCLVLSPAVSAHFTVKLCVTAWNCEKFTKTFYFRGSRSFKVIDVDIAKKLITSACYDKQHVCAYICNHFHARRANSGKITSFKGDALFCLFVHGDPLDLAAWNFVTKYYRL